MNSIDYQRFSQSYLDGMTPNEWLRWAQTLNWLYVNKVSRTPLDDQE